MSLSHHTTLYRTAIIIALAATSAAQAQAGMPYGASSGEPVAQPVQATTSLPGIHIYSGEPAAPARFGSLIGGTGPLAEPVLVIPGKQMEPQAVAQIVEDLSVMGRIIEKNLSEDPAFRDIPMDLPMTGFLNLKNSKIRWTFPGAQPDAAFSGAGWSKPMYIGGYGAVFFLRVGVPLLPPPEVPQPATTAEKVDPVWADARRSLLEPQSTQIPLGQPGAAPEPYSAERVDALKNQLISAMKYATNIHGLDPTDRLIVVVQGTRAVTSNAPPDTNAPGKTVLTLRATRADIELFAADKIDRKQFEQRVQAITY